MSDNIKGGEYPTVDSIPRTKNKYQVGDAVEIFGGSGSLKGIILEIGHTKIKVQEFGRIKEPRWVPTRRVCKYRAIMKLKGGGTL